MHHDNHEGDDEILDVSFEETHIEKVRILANKTPESPGFELKKLEMDLLKKEIAEILEDRIRKSPTSSKMRLSSASENSVSISKTSKTTSKASKSLKTSNDGRKN